jgi:hypothetical protein
MTRAACRGAAFSMTRDFRESDPFFPEKGQDRSEAAANFCITCPVITECRKYRRSIGAKHGVWGGNHHDETQDS